MIKYFRTQTPKNIMYPKLLIADSRNRIFDIDGMIAVGMKAGNFYPLMPDELIPLPFASELFVLKGRIALGISAAGGTPQELKHNPFGSKYERCFPVAAFLSPGYTATFNTAYLPGARAKLLPLFSYAAVCWYKGGFYVPAVRVERERRQDLRLMDMRLVHKNIAGFKRRYPKNRLLRHLADCAAKYGCPAAINFFLQRYECPLPVSPSCNSLCVGCISIKHSPTCPAVQPRIRFVPAPREVAEVALFHISAARRPVVSFGQGCEGEPLMVADVLEESVKLIRQKTKKGVINLNTNASRPIDVRRLRLAGLDSIRVSINSARERFYNAYYKPIDYRFKDVMSSINVMKRLGGFVSINCLVMPGFTDTVEEAAAFFDFIRKTKIDMVQWRNLNYDPVDYFKKLKIADVSKDKLIGVRQFIQQAKQRFPGLRHGYFNPRVL